VDLHTAIADLVIANRILAYKNVLDSFGHVSVRHPENPERYLMSRSRAPGLISEEDILEFSLEGEPIDGASVPLFGERPIHGCIYRSRRDAVAVCHNHAYGLLPFSVTKTAMRPAIHVAAVIGEEVPVWDIRDDFGDTNLLVNTDEKARSLVAALGDRRAILMRGHGSVVVGASIREMVFTSYYLQVNAEILIQSCGLGEVQYLSPEEVTLSAAVNLAPLAQDRIWEDWVRQAGFPSVPTK
jgi:HCOMODA/2-hydroxy-3-carboxy-muconic semialdehyde decarboxylase